MAPTLTKLQKVGVALALLSAADEERKQKRKRKWMESWLKERDQLVLNSNFTESLGLDDVCTMLRMEKGTFYELLGMVRPLLEKKDTTMRRALSAEERLIVTLKFLASGRDYRNLRFSTRISHQALSAIIPETCRAIFKNLKKTIKLPSTEKEWKMSAKLFETQWQFNNCIGCMDGKQILVHRPKMQERKSKYFIVAVVNANYEFMRIHTGTKGSMYHGNVIDNTKFSEELKEKELCLSEPYVLPNTDITVPYVFLGDNAFALNTNIMTPFPERNISKKEKVFNYRLCRARRVAENAFGILASRFRVFKQTMNLKLENANAVVLACCALHNFLIKNSKTYLTPTCVDHEDLENFTLIDGSWRQTAAKLTPLQRNNQISSNEGQEIRNILTEFFNGVGSVTFQDKMSNI